MENHHVFNNLMGNPTISMAIFHSYVKLPDGTGAGLVNNINDITNMVQN